MCRISANNLTNEKGNPLVAVTDASRNKFVMRYDDGDRPDNGGYKTCAILHPPFIEASMESYSKDGNKETLELINDMNDKPIADNLSKVLPLSLDVLHDDERKMLQTMSIKKQKLLEKFKGVKIAVEKKEKQNKELEDADGRGVKTNKNVRKCISPVA